MKTNKAVMGMSLLAAMAFAPLASAQVQVIVDDQFNYADQTALAAAWTLGANSPLSLNTTDGNPSPSVTSPATGVNPNISKAVFSLTPSDANPIRMTADILSTGAANSTTTVGLRTGANPLFEMGLYRSMDNLQTGFDSSMPANGTGIGIRALSIGIDLTSPGGASNQDWVKMGNYYTGWARFEATIYAKSVTTQIDLGIDGTWDLIYREEGPNQIGAFTDLRIHAPAAPSGTPGAIVDNVKLEVVPEPSTYALLSLGGVALAFASRRKR